MGCSEVNSASKLEVSVAEVCKQRERHATQLSVKTGEARSAPPPQLEQRTMFG